MNDNELLINRTGVFENLDKVKTLELKGFAILLVVFLHISSRLLSINNYYHGEFGVDIFVILSGMGVTFSYLSSNRTLNNFIKSRVIKIFPAYWITLVIIFIINKYVMNMQIDIKDYIIHFFGLQAYTLRYFYTIGDQLWYMSLILTLYILFIIISKYIIEYDVETILKMGISFSIVAWSYFRITDNIQGEIFFAPRVMGFFFGICIALLIKQSYLKIKLDIGICFLVLIQIYLMFNRGIPFNYPLAGLMIMIIYIRITLIFNHSMILKYIRTCLYSIGKYSYEIYLIHFLLMITLNDFILKNLFEVQSIKNSYIIIGGMISFLITIIISVILNKIISTIIFKS